MRRFLGTAAVFVFLSKTFLAGSAWAFTPTISPKGVPVRWHGSVKLNLAGNPVNRSGLSPQNVFDTVVLSLQRWKAASGGNVDFDYWQGTNPGIYEPNSNYNGLSSIYFASNSNGSTPMDSNVLGLTQVWYNTDTGQILETDVALNDIQFKFTMNPADTSGYGGQGSGSSRNVYLGNVVTHELGHAFGLSHAGGLQSTMLFMESPEQAHLACDELVAIHAIYPTGDASRRGAITGALVSESGSPIFGAQVLAISRQRGVVLASAMTDHDGRYTLEALEPGTYFIMAEPFFAGPSALPGYFSSSNSSTVCAGHSFGRTFLADASSGSQLTGIEIGSGSQVGAPTLVAHCSTGGAAVIGNPASSQASTAPVIFDGGSGFGVRDRMDPSRERYYSLKRLSGRLEVHALAYSLYSPIHPTMMLLDSRGQPVPAQVAEHTYRGDSGYVNYDSALLAENLPAGNYLIRVNGSPLDVSKYPAGPLALDSTGFLVLAGSANEADPPLVDEIPRNARCLMNETFAAYQSPPGNPPRASTQQLGQDEGVGFCATIQSNSGTGGASNDGGHGGGPGAAAIAGWLLPWLVMALIPKVLKWRGTRISLSHS